MVGLPFVVENWGMIWKIPTSKKYKFARFEN